MYIIAGHERHHAALLRERYLSVASNGSSRIELQGGGGHMMRLWVQSYSKSTPVVPSATLSVVAHAVIICRVGRRHDADAQHAAGEPRESSVLHPSAGSLARHARISRDGALRGATQRNGLGMGDGPRIMGDERPAAPIVDETAGRQGRDTTTSPPVAPIAGPPEIRYSRFSTSTPRWCDRATARRRPIRSSCSRRTSWVRSRRSTSSTRPVLPTRASFDSAEVRRIPEFITAVREALPYMRFTPRRSAALKVRQLVEQQFSFRITDTATVAPSEKRP